MKKILCVLSVVAFLLLLVQASPAVDADSYEYGFTSYYDQLDDNEKAVYDGFGTFSPGNLEVSVELPHPVFTADGGNAEKYLGESIDSIVLQAWSASMLDDPWAFWTWGTSMFQISELELVRDSGFVGVERVTVTVNMDPAYADDPSTEDVDELQKKIDALRKAVDSFTTGKTDARGIVGAVNDYLTNTSEIIYDPDAGEDNESPYSHDAYGALIALTEHDGKKYHMAVCDGYSEAFKMLCDKYDVKSIIVYGNGNQKSETEYHAWNNVLMDDGKWYGMDVTWNVDTSDSFILTGSLTVWDGNGFTFSASHAPTGVVYLDVDGKIKEAVTFLTPSLSEDKYDEDPKTSVFDEYGPMIFVILVVLVFLVALVLMNKEGNKKRGA